MKTKNKNIFRFLLPRNWGIVKVIRDFENYYDWIRTIKREQANPQSNFNKWKLERTKLYDVFVIVSLEEEDALLPEAVQRTKVVESLNPLHRYLDDELGFAECLNCEFNQFEDDNGKLTLSYLILYRFNFNKFSIKWLIKFIVVTSILAVIIVKLNVIPTLISWISRLM